jgi:hypothetical protein
MQPGLTQEYLFQLIKENLSPNDSLVEVVADLLNLSNDSAYRRIRGETPLILDEARILCERFSISLDGLLKTNPGSITFSSVEVDTKEKSFENYLGGLLSNLQYISSANQKEIIYLSKDIPVFYNFLYRPLFAFRYFFWMKSIIQHPDFTNLPFSLDMLPYHVEELGWQINKVYNTIPSTQIWNTECVNSLISQIEYYREAGYFKSETDIDIIYTSLHELIEHIRERADSGTKFMPGENSISKKENFNFFYNRIVLGDNTILVLLDDKKLVYLSYDVLNYMVTHDEAFCNNVHSKLQMMMKRSTLLSKASEKQRNIFFNLLIKKIPARSATINNNSK